MFGWLLAALRAVLVQGASSRGVASESFETALGIQYAWVFQPALCIRQVWARRLYGLLSASAYGRSMTIGISPRRCRTVRDIARSICHQESSA
ncbi:MAG: hypothetical protein QOC89_5017 [Paraburkholderia sp.]|nr:hypothetical protein [Paraburkholderia sp.]